VKRAAQLPAVLPPTEWPNSVLPHCLFRGLISEQCDCKFADAINGLANPVCIRKCLRMSELYPQSWRDACLALLRGRRAELHRKLGYKRMSWEPVRNEVMRDYDKADDLGIFRQDDRLIRQNFDSWERGQKLSDEKFAFIDRYVRKLSISGEDKFAREAVRNQTSLEISKSLSKMYLNPSTNLGIISSLFEKKWTIASEEISDSWFSSIVIRCISETMGVISVVVAYIPVIYKELSEKHFGDIVFFDGFIIPMENSIKKDILSDRDVISATLKMVRPEFRGISDLGYADGEFNFVGALSENKFEATEFFLKFPNPALRPSISKQWKDFNEQVSRVYTVTRGGFSDQNKILVGSRSEIKFKQIAGYYSDLSHISLDVIDNLFNNMYKGYI
jgi:hypothetical protein